MTAIDRRFVLFEAKPRTTEVADDPGFPDESIGPIERHHSVPTDTYARELLVELLDPSE